MDVQVSLPPPPPPPPPPAFFSEMTTAEPTSLTSPPPPAPQATTTTIVASSAAQDRIWLHPWTVTEMRANASQWSLAGDAGLLLYLEQFSDKLVQRADTIQQHLSQTVNAVKSTHTRVQNCLNEFTSLANTQFIESRVYDEDETESVTASKKDEQSTEKANVSNTEAQEKVLQRYVEAIQYGLAILDTHFERVDPKSESVQNGGASFVYDDEDGGVPIEPILEPKDPYMFRPLPNLIGTAEFMQDDYVGLGDLLNPHDEDGYDAEQMEKVDTDSAFTPSDQEDEDDPDDFKVVSTVAIVPAGASRPDLANRTATTTVLTDSENDDDDPFGIKNAPKKFDDFSIDRPTEKDDMFGELIIPPIEKKTKAFSLDQDSDSEETIDFGITSNKPPPIIENNDFDKESTTSKESDESSPPPPKVMSELEKAVLRRRMKMGDPELPPQEDEEEDEFVRKPSKTSNQTVSPFGIKPKTSKPPSEGPSSSTISNLAAQPLTKPTIFGQHTPIDDDDDDIFDAAPKLNSLPPLKPIVDEKPPTISVPKKEKDVFDDVSDEDDNPFVTRKIPTPSVPPIKKIDSNSKIQPTLIQKRPLIIPQDESENEELFGETKKPEPIKIPTLPKKKDIAKRKSSSSDDDLFQTPIAPKPPNPPTKSKIPNDEDSSSTNKSKIQPPVVPSPSAPTATLPIKTPVSAAAEDSDEELFGLIKTTPKVPTSKTQNVTPSVKSDEDDELFVGKTTQSNVSTVKIPKDDEEGDLFPSKPSQLQLPPEVVLPPLPPAPTVKTSVYKDPLSGITKPVGTTSQPPIVEPIKAPTVVPRKTSTSDSDEELFSRRPQNVHALKEGEKLDVKGLAARLKIDPKAHTGGAVRPKAHSITEEPSPPPPQPKSSLDDDNDDEPIQKPEPPPPVVKKLSPLDFDSDEDDLFSDKKKSTPIPPASEQKDKTNVQPGKLNMSELSSRIKIPTSAAPPKPIPAKEKESNNTPLTTPTETQNEESTFDKTTTNILIGRAKPPARTRALPTRTPRSATAASADETDDLFALPNSTTNVTSPPPASIPVTPPPAAISVTSPPPAPVTGLLNTAAIAAISDKPSKSKEKKKFSLFDSDDSDIDELLFGVNKKNKSAVVSKPTTTPSKVTTKAAMLPLDDDDDFLSKRPIKKNTKAADNDDIFADVKGKGQQTNKAKKDWAIMEKTTGGADDIFNDPSAATAKSSASSKPKPTNVKSKSTKDLDDIFDDPLNVSSKR